MGDNGDVCVFCYNKSDLEKLTMYDKCQATYCNDFIHKYTSKKVTVGFSQHVGVHLGVLESMLAHRAHRANFSLIFPQFPPFFRIFCPRVGETLLFENGYFDASFILGILYIWIFTHFRQFSHIFCSFPPQLFFSRLIYPHHGDPEKTRVRVM